MAMYKDTDINAALISETFPDVAAEIIAGASSADAPTVTAESMRESHPDIVAAFQAEGKASAGADVEAAVAADRERIATIQSMSKPGYESIIAAAVADASVTPDQVKIQLFDAQEANVKSTFDQHKEDGKKLGSTLAELSGGSEEGGDSTLSEDEQAEASMEAAGEKARGEA